MENPSPVNPFDGEFALFFQRKKCLVAGGEIWYNKSLNRFYPQHSARRRGRGDTMGIHDGHRARKRAQYLRHGLDSFADHEVLELLLFYAIPRRDVNDLAHTLLATFGSLENVFAASPEELRAIPGLGEGAATLLGLIPDVQRRLRRQGKRERVYNTPEKVGGYLLRVLGDRRQEQLYMLCLDGKGKLLGEKVLSTGDGVSTALPQRQVVNFALSCGATAVVLGHNHPSGVALPSEEDRVSTLQVEEILRSVDVRLLDHIVVADGDYVSMRQSGYLIH